MKWVSACYIHAAHSHGKRVKSLCMENSHDFWQSKMSNYVSQIKYFLNPNIWYCLYFYRDIDVLVPSSFTNDKSSFFSKNKPVVQSMLLLRDCNIHNREVSHTLINARGQLLYQNLMKICILTLFIRFESTLYVMNTSIHILYTFITYSEYPILSVFYNIVA